MLKAVGKERQHTQHIPNTALSLSHTHKRTHTTHSLYLYLVLVGATYCVLYRESVLYMECVQRVEQARTHKHECAPHPRAPEITQNCGNREYVALVDRYRICANPLDASEHKRRGIEQRDELRLGWGESCGAMSNGAISASSRSAMCARDARAASVEPAAARRK